MPRFELCTGRTQGSLNLKLFKKQIKKLSNPNRRKIRRIRLREKKSLRKGRKNKNLKVRSLIVKRQKRDLQKWRKSVRQKML
jgi:hypothetical protein